MEKQNFNVLDVIIILLKRKTFIMVFTLIFSLIAVCYSLLATEYWTSKFLVLPLASQGLGSIGSLAESIGLAAGATTTPKQLGIKYSALLKSKTITHITIDKFDLINYYKVKIKDGDKDKALETVYKVFHNDMFDIKLSDETYFMSVAVTTKNKQFSKEIAEYYLETLLDYVKNNKNNTGRQKRELFETRVDQVMSEIEGLVAIIGEYQKENNIIDIENQAKAAIEGYYKVLVDLVELDVELIYTEKFLQNSPKHISLKEKKDSFLEALQKLEKESGETPYLLPLNNITDSYLTIQDIKMRIEVLEKVLMTIYPQLELARIEEIDNMDQIEIIDYPNIPGKRSHPKRALICVLTFFVSLLFASGSVLVYDHLNTTESDKIKEIWKNLFR
ncbi:MAG: Wzz/FepE/Etk N-terminal domain-containing protein [Candidatus Cloacimonetes bacterium]|nr:Wzz/FepE/Etk N-terminal domain-containing protein [Candidatus Cloacimonadota bacterium]